MAENFPRLMKDVNPKIREAQGNPGQINKRKTTVGNKTVKWLKINNKEKILKSS